METDISPVNHLCFLCFLTYTIFQPFLSVRATFVEAVKCILYFCGVMTGRDKPDSLDIPFLTKMQFNMQIPKVNCLTLSYW